MHNIQAPLSLTNNINLNGSTTISTALDGVTIRSSADSSIYICEKWQSRNPIYIGDDLYISLKEDLIPYSELKKKIFDKILEEFPDKALKLNLNMDNIDIKKILTPIEINI